MATTEERLAALETKLAALTDTTPTNYYTHQYSGEEIDAAVGRAVTGGALDTSVTNVSNQLGTFVRPNLLDNWYFGRPVNQRGETEWLSSSSSAIPCVDRWTWWGQYITGTRLNLLDDGLQLAKPAEGQGLYQAIIQKVEKTRVPVGATVTLSALVKAEANSSIILSIGGQNYASAEVKANVWEIITYTVNAPSVEQTHNISIQRNTPGVTFTVKAVKLELGPTQTLAHREGDRWVLNEVPKFGRELAECQRYFWRMHSIAKNNYAIFAYGMKQSADQVRFVIPFPATFRVSPAITANGKFLVSDGIKDYAVDSIDRQSFNGESIVLVAKLSTISALPDGTLMRFGAFNDHGAYVDFSADL